MALYGNIYIYIYLYIYIYISPPPLRKEVFIVTIQGRGNFYTNNETNGDIYKIEGDDEDVGDQVGKFVNKVATFI